MLYKALMGSIEALELGLGMFFIPKSLPFLSVGTNKTQHCLYIETLDPSSGLKRGFKPPLKVDPSIEFFLILPFILFYKSLSMSLPPRLESLFVIFKGFFQDPILEAFLVRLDR